jgi:hypothetical protein
MKIILLAFTTFFIACCNTSNKGNLLQQWVEKDNSTPFGSIKNLNILTEADSVQEIQKFFNGNQIQKVKSEAAELIMVGWSTFSGRSGKHWYIYLKQRNETKYNLVAYRYYEGKTKKTYLKLKSDKLHIYNRYGKSIMSIPIKTLFSPTDSD